MSEPQRIHVRLSIPADEYLAYYRHEADQVMARSVDGRSVQFPASALRRHVTRAGISGLFEIVVDGDNRLLRLDRIGE